MRKPMAATVRPDEDPIDLMARLRAENAELRERVRFLEVDVEVGRTLLSIALQDRDDALGLPRIDRLGEPDPVPERLSIALRFGRRGGQVTVPVFGTDVTIILGNVGAHVDAARAAHVFERIEAIVDEVSDQGRPGATGMFRMSLPEQVAALVWRLPDGTPVTVVSNSTKRCALRSALRAAGHELIREA